MSLADVFNSIAGIAETAGDSIGGGQLASAELRTSILPPISVAYNPHVGAGGGAGKPAQGAQPAGGGTGLAGLTANLNPIRWLKPAWTVKTPIGTIDGAPFGEPGRAYLFVLPLLVVAVVGMVALAGYGLAMVLKKARRPA